MIVFTISYMAALFPSQKAVYPSSTKCSYIIPNLQRRSAPLVVLTNALSNLHGTFFLCSVLFLDLLTFPRLPSKITLEFPAASLWCQIRSFLSWVIGSCWWNTPSTSFLKEMEENFAETCTFLWITSTHSFYWQSRHLESCSLDIFSGRITIGIGILSLTKVSVEKTSRSKGVVHSRAWLCSAKSL